MNLPRALPTSRPRIGQQSTVVLRRYLPYLVRPDRNLLPYFVFVVVPVFCEPPCTFKPSRSSSCPLFFVCWLAWLFPPRLASDSSARSLLKNSCSIHHAEHFSRDEKLSKIQGQLLLGCGGGPLVSSGWSIHAEDSKYSPSWCFFPGSNCL